MQSALLLFLFPLLMRSMDNPFMMPLVLEDFLKALAVYGFSFDWCVLLSKSSAI